MTVVYHNPMREIDDTTFEADLVGWLDLVDQVGVPLVVRRTAGSVVVLQLEEYERLSGKKVGYIVESEI